MAMLISNAILHIVGNYESNCYYSKQELDVDSETCIEFVSRHVRRLMNNAAAKEATFRAESQVYSLVHGYQKGELYFKDFSERLCERLAGILSENKDIPPADLLVAAFDNKNVRYLAILKLNYGECFTHRIVEGEAGAETQIVKNTAVLPFSGGRVEEACLIPFDPMVLRVMERPYPVGGEETNYFSELFLECETEMSKKETAEIIHQIAEEINLTYYNDDVELAARVKNVLIDEAAESEEEDPLILENVASRVFFGNEEAATRFVERAKDEGLPHQLKLDKPFMRQEFKTHKFKADNGIEVKVPAELFDDPGTVSFTTNSDGTVSITLKNLRKSVKA